MRKTFAGTTRIVSKAEHSRPQGQCCRRPVRVVSQFGEESTKVLVL